MIDRFKSRAEAFEQELKSWSQGAHPEWAALRENLIEIEKHIREQRTLLRKRQREIADLTREKLQLQSMIEKLLCSSDEFLTSGPTRWISDLREGCSILIDAATEAEPDSDDPAATATDVEIPSGIPAAAQGGRIETQESPSDAANGSAQSEPDGSLEVQGKKEELASELSAFYRPTDEEKKRYDNLMTRVERLMSHGGMQ